MILADVPRKSAVGDTGKVLSRQGGRTRIAFVGCGFVADLYARTLALHPQLELSGVFDRDPQRSDVFARHFATKRYRALGELLDDDCVEIVVNLTNPRSHFEVSTACLEAGKHVYSEKPLAMDMSEARWLTELAEERGLLLSGAPCSVLGETAQTVWRALRKNVVGRVRLVYAELDDGLLHRMAYRKWFSGSGTPWPYKNEFQTGCTLEHAGYYLTWLAAFFGPVERLVAFSSVQVPDKDRDVPPASMGPDFSVACMRFDSGVTARLTCSVVAPHDHSLRIVGDQGVLCMRDCWHYRSPVWVYRRIALRRKTFLLPWRRRLPLAGRELRRTPSWGAAQMDWCRGIAEMVDAIRQNRPNRLSAAYCLHMTELALAIHSAGIAGCSRTLATSFEPMEPMSWAKS